MRKRRLGETQNNKSWGVLMVNNISTETNPPLTSALGSEIKSQL